MVGRWVSGICESSAEVLVFVIPVRKGKLCVIFLGVLAPWAASSAQINRRDIAGFVKMAFFKNCGPLKVVY